MLSSVYMHVLDEIEMKDWIRSLPKSTASKLIRQKKWTQVIAPLLGMPADPITPMKTRSSSKKNNKKGQGLMYTSIPPPKITAKTKKQNKTTKKKEGKGLKKNAARMNPRAPVKTVYLPGDINSLHKQLFHLMAEYQSGNKSLRPTIVAILNNLRRRKAITKNEYNIKLNSVYE